MQSAASVTLGSKQPFGAQAFNFHYGPSPLINIRNAQGSLRLSWRVSSIGIALKRQDERDCVLLANLQETKKTATLREVSAAVYSDAEIGRRSDPGTFFGLNDGGTQGGGEGTAVIYYAVIGRR